MPVTLPSHGASADQVLWSAGSVLHGRPGELQKLGVVAEKGPVVTGVAQGRFEEGARGDQERKSIVRQMTRMYAPVSNSN